MNQRLLKLARRLRWSLPVPGCVALRWHVGRPNFGDDLNPVLWQAILARRVRLGACSGRHVLGMGSILERATSRSLVAGSGFLRPPRPDARVSCPVLSVRGRLSAACVPGPVMLGDPAVLTPLLFPRPARPRTAVGIVPHVTELEAARATMPAGAEVIDVRGHPLEVVRRIASCRRILSQSLHGLIVADAYGVPNAWLAPSSGMIGGRFKFDDYYSTTDRRPEPIAVTPRDWESLDGSCFAVSTFVHDRGALLEGMRDGVLGWWARGR
jgi:pyruvyltransferase